MKSDDFYQESIEALAMAITAGCLNHDQLVELVSLLGLQNSTDTIEPLIDTIIAQHPDKVAEYRSGKTKLIGFFVGQVMKQTRTADPKTVNERFIAKLSVA